MGQITRRRADFLAATLKGSEYVQINVVPFGNSLSAEEGFRKIINRLDGSFEKDIDSPDGTDGLLSGVFAQPDTIEQRIDGLKKAVLAIRDGDETTLKDRRFGSHVWSLGQRNAHSVAVTDLSVTHGHRGNKISLLPTS